MNESAMRYIYQLHYQDVWVNDSPLYIISIPQVVFFSRIFYESFCLCILAVESRVSENLQQLQQDCFRLENMARKEVPTRRQNAKL